MIYLSYQKLNVMDFQLDVMPTSLQDVLVRAIDLTSTRLRRKKYAI